MAEYNTIEGDPIPDLVLFNYPILSELSMDHITMLQVDVEGLKDGPYHPNVTGLDYCHKVVAKDLEWGGTSCLETDMMYPVELKSAYCKGNKSFEGLLCLLEWKEKKGDGMFIIRWDRIEDMDNCGKFRRNKNPTNSYRPSISSTEQARRKMARKNNFRKQ